VKKQNLIFDLFGVVFLFNKYAILKKIGIWKSLIFTLKMRKNPADHCFFLLDQMRLASKEEFQEIVAYKNLYLPETLCLWQKGLIKNEEAVRRVINYLDTVPDDVIGDRTLMHNIFSTAFTTQGILSAVLLNASVYKQLLCLKKEHHLYVLSNIDPETWMGIQQRFPQVIQLFDGIVISGEKHLIKPDPAIFQYLCDKYQLHPATCVMIDDQPENGAAARQLGMRTILYRQGCHISPEVTA
jgi:HAD superfamily hydrolase (TIGR01509 family)